MRHQSAHDQSSRQPRGREEPTSGTSGPANFGSMTWGLACSDSTTEEAFAAVASEAIVSETRERRTLARRINQLLDGLGQSADAVAMALVSAGARGQYGDLSSTPIASFLSAVVGSDPAVESVSLSPGTCTIVRRAHWRRTLTITLPPAIRDFTLAFEAGCYPVLVGGGDER
jgi:hypothetical protein